MSVFAALIDRPIRATVIGLVILLLGLQAMLQLTVREYPQTTTATIIVTTPYIGANAELVRGFITTPLEQAIATAEGIDYLQSTSLPGISTITTRLELNYDPNDAVAEILTKIQQVVSQIAGLQSVVISPPSLPGAGGGTPVQFVISSVEEPRVVLQATEQILSAARESGLFIYIDSDLKFDRPQFEVVIDRDRAAALGIDISQFGGDLATMLSGGNVNYFSYDGRSYRVIPQVDRSYRLNPEQLLDYRIATRTGDLVPVSSFASLKKSVEPQALHRFNQLNSATLSGVPTPGVSLGEAIEFLRDEAENSLSQEFITDWTGRSRQFVSKSASMLVAFGLAVVLMYLTLAFQYESFRNPAVMLISVPMSLVGALLFFAVGLVSLNIYTQIGLLALIGSIIRHGILLVEFARDIQLDQRVNRRQAIEKAASLRFRSILMTTTATVVGLIPLLLATGGPGAASRFAISFTLGVGMALGTLFTLFVVPALYTVLASRSVPAENAT
jgi:multidrug efflux pump